MTLDDLINTGEPREIKRALAVKMFMHGSGREYISTILSVTQAYVTKWNVIYRNSGASGLRLGYIGSEGYLDDYERSEIIQYINSKDSITLEYLCKYIKENYGVTYASRQSYYNLLHDAEMSWKKTEKSNPKRDEEVVLEKREEIKKKLLENEADIRNGSLVVLLEDECHLVWQDVLGYVWGKKGVAVQVPMTNGRERQTYYGVVNYVTHEVIVREYDAGNGKNTVSFLKYLQCKYSSSRLLIIWDGASYHKYAETREYLKEINDGIEEKDWPITCVLFAPNAPDQNMMEDIWLQGKSFIRKIFTQLNSFWDVKNNFQEFLETKKFDFCKLSLYGIFI